MSILDLAIINLGSLFILIYKLNYVYWIRYAFVRPFIFKGVKSKIDMSTPPDLKGRRYSPEYKERMLLWAAYSTKSFKPFTCYSCLVLWVSVIECVALDPSINQYLSTPLLIISISQEFALCLGSFIFASLIQKQYES